MAIRHAEQNDYETVLEMWEEFRNSRPFDVPYDKDMFEKFIKFSIGRHDDFFLMILDDNQGFMYGCLSPSLYCPKPIAQELAWYTRDTGRGKGMELFRAFMKWAKRLEVDYVYCSLATPNPVMERLGFKMADVGYTKRISDFDEIVKESKSLEAAE